MNAESSRLRSTGTTSSGIRAIWPGALLVVYLAITGVILLAGWQRVPPSGIAIHFGMMALIAFATWARVVPRWLRDWTPLLALLLLYSEMPMVIRAAGHSQPYDWAVMQWEGALFGGQPAFDWALRVPSVALSEVLHLSYLSYYPIIYSVPAALYFRGRREDFHRAAFVLLLAFVVCFLFYAMFPVAGPRYLWPSRASDGPIRSFVVWLLENRSSRGTAFPSSHVAVAVTQSLLAWQYFGRRGLVVAALAVGLAAGAVYGGFHYAVDVLAGAAVGVGCWRLGMAITGERSRERERTDVPVPDVRTGQRIEEKIER